MPIDRRKTDRTIRIPISVLYKLGIKICGVFLKGKTRMYYLCGKRKKVPKSGILNKSSHKLRNMIRRNVRRRRILTISAIYSTQRVVEEEEEEERARMHCLLHTPFPLSRGIPTWSFTWKKTARRMGERQISNKM